uniref:Uncharacterized protein n=1 Tax=Kalanchoe fedtschenkoi TaxID=63787 RepID=A0A7N0RFA4_KALFE
MAATVGQRPVLLSYMHSVIHIRMAPPISGCSISSNTRLTCTSVLKATWKKRILDLYASFSSYQSSPSSPARPVLLIKLIDMALRLVASLSRSLALSLELIEVMAGGGGGAPGKSEHIRPRISPPPCIVCFDLIVLLHHPPSTVA